MDRLALLSSAGAAIAVFLAVLSIDELWATVAGKYVADLDPQLRDLGINRSKIPTLLRCWGIALICSIAVALYAPALALVAVYFTWIAPRLWIHHLISNRKRQLRDQMVGASTGIANAARAGLALPQCFETIAAESPEPIKSELLRIFRDWSNGTPLTTAINHVKERLRIDSFSLFAPAIVTAMEHGGKIPDALERISYTLQEIQRLERKVDADTAAGRKTVWLLSMFPIFFLGMFLLIFPEGTIKVFTTWMGQLILAVVIVMTYVAIRWSLRILAIDF